MGLKLRSLCYTFPAKYERAFIILQAPFLAGQSAAKRKPTCSNP